MRPFVVFLAAAALALALAACATPPAAKASTTFTGYLLDVACGAGGQGMDGSDVVNSPQDHSTKCLVACRGSGFGIMAKEGRGFRFIPFDKAGSDLADRIVLQKTAKANNIAVQVMGTLEGGVLVVSSIKEIDKLM